MKEILFFILFVLPIGICSQTITGKIVVDQQTPLPSVLVININTNGRTLSDSEGHFSIAASINDELRFVKQGYERSMVKISSSNSSVYVNMLPSYKDIEEVKVNPIKLTGDINKDAALLAKKDKVEELQTAIGVPKAPEKPRERPAELVKNVLLPIIVGQLDVQALYDVASGKARRQKHLYKLEDQQSDVQWMRKRIEKDYFINVGIPENKISEFIEFAFSQNPKIRTYVKANNMGGVLAEMEPAFEIYLSRMK